MSVHSQFLSAPLRKVTAFHDLPSLAVPERHSNPSSYPSQRPSPGERVPNESPLPLTSASDSPNPSIGRVRDRIENWLSGISEGDCLEMYRSSEKFTSDSSSLGSPKNWIPVPRRGSWMLLPRRCALVFGACLVLWSLNSIMSRTKHHGVILSHRALYFSNRVC